MKEGIAMKELTKEEFVKEIRNLAKPHCKSMWGGWASFLYDRMQEIQCMPGRGGK